MIATSTLRSFLALALAGVTLGVTTAAQQATGAIANPARPRLVVLCGVDQLARWVFDAGRPFFAEDGGFAELQRRGATFTNCAFEHACTETGPGHATIGTGAPAALHGIARNRWYSPQSRRAVYCAGAAAAPLPGLDEGKNRGAGRLLAPTLAEVMEREIPGTRTVGVSWKDRSAILMVGDHADTAAWIETGTGRLVTNRTWGPQVPEWVAQFNRDGVIDSFFDWEWTRTGPAAAYDGLVDDRPYESKHGASDSRSLPARLVGKGGRDRAFYSQVYNSPAGNEIIRIAATRAVDGMQLGQDDTPDLLAVSFSSTDVVGHYFGPDSVESRDALLRLDRELATLLTFLDERVGRDRYAFFLTADHGVGPTPEWAKERGLDAGRGVLQVQARAAAERDIKRELGDPPAGQRYIAHVGEWALVLNGAAFAGEDGELRRARAAQVAAAAVGNVRGMKAGYTTAEILAGAHPDDAIVNALRAALHPDRAGDVQLVPQPYWLDGSITASHGTPHDYDREVVGLVFGPGVPAGVTIDDPVTPGLGAVLFARMLGIPIPALATAAVPAALND